MDNNEKELEPTADSSMDSVADGASNNATVQTSVRSLINTINPQIEAIMHPQKPTQDTLKAMEQYLTSLSVNANQSFNVNFSQESFSRKLTLKVDDNKVIVFSKDIPNNAQQGAQQLQSLNGASNVIGYKSRNSVADVYWVAPKNLFTENSNITQLLLNEFENETGENVGKETTQLNLNNDEIPLLRPPPGFSPTPQYKGLLDAGFTTSDSMETQESGSSSGAVRLVPSLLELSGDSDARATVSSSSVNDLLFGNDANNGLNRELGAASSSSYSRLGEPPIQQRLDSGQDISAADIYAVSLLQNFANSETALSSYNRIRANMAANSSRSSRKQARPKSSKAMQTWKRCVRKANKKLKRSLDTASRMKFPKETSSLLRPVEQEHGRRPQEPESTALVSEIQKIPQRLLEEQFMYEEVERHWPNNSLLQNVDFLSKMFRDAVISASPDSEISNYFLSKTRNELMGIILQNRLQQRASGSLNLAAGSNSIASNFATPYSSTSGNSISANQRELLATISRTRLEDPTVFKFGSSTDSSNMPSTSTGNIIPKKEVVLDIPQNQVRDRTESSYPAVPPISTGFNFVGNILQKIQDELMEVTPQNWVKDRSESFPAVPSSTGVNFASSSTAESSGNILPKSEEPLLMADISQNQVNDRTEVSFPAVPTSSTDLKFTSTSGLTSENIYSKGPEDVVVGVSQNQVKEKTESSYPAVPSTSTGFNYPLCAASTNANNLQKNREKIMPVIARNQIKDRTGSSYPAVPSTSGFNRAPRSRLICPRSQELMGILPRSSVRRRTTNSFYPTVPTSPGYNFPVTTGLASGNYFPKMRDIMMGIPQNQVKDRTASSSYPAVPTSSTGFNFVAASSGNAFQNTQESFYPSVPSSIGFNFAPSSSLASGNHVPKIHEELMANIPQNRVTESFYPAVPTTSSTGFNFTATSDSTSGNNFPQLQEKSMVADSQSRLRGRTESLYPSVPTFGTATSSNLASSSRSSSGNIFPKLQEELKSLISPQTPVRARTQTSYSQVLTSGVTKGGPPTVSSTGNSFASNQEQLMANISQSQLKGRAQTSYSAAVISGTAKRANTVAPPNQELRSSIFQCQPRDRNDNVPVFRDDVSKPTILPLNQSNRCAQPATLSSANQTTNNSITLTVEHYLCAHCVQNNESVFLPPHRMHDLQGRVICPALRQITCSICNATGDNAHTVQECAVRKQWDDMMN